MQTLLISGARIIDPSQSMDVIGDLLIEKGKIAWVGEEGASPSQQNITIISARRMIASPGFIDLHCHLREPGFEEKETIATGTRAAAAGGFATLCCMPNTEPPVDTAAAVEYINTKARTDGAVRVLPVGCITQGRKGERIAEMERLAMSGVVGFSDDGSPVMNSLLMRHALEYSCLFDLPVIEHCEDILLSEGGVMNEGRLSARMGLGGMPAAAEESLLARDLALAELTGARIHIAHVSTAGSVELIRRARERGIKVTAEVTPHHLTLTEERVAGYDTDAKVNPPLRTDGDVEALLRGLREGVIDAIATDHSPHKLADKMCEFGLAAFGISGLETALGSLMGLVHSGKLDLKTLLYKLTAGPAVILAKGSRESPLYFNNPVPRGVGTLQVGAPGDVTIFDPDLEWVVDPQAFASKGKNTPWAGHSFKGKVVATVVGGEIVYQDRAIEVCRAASPDGLG